MNHDLFRSLKGGKPFMLMESTPSGTNWQATSKLKKPGMHLLSSLQAVAHGSDTVQYFQWRKSRGSSEKFHGAVVDHCGHENTRVFRDVTQVGTVLEKLDEVLGTSLQPEVAIIFDWENRWAINDSQGPRNCGMKYEETVHAQYKTFWESGVPVDIIDMECDFSSYKLLVAPMLYMVKPCIQEKIETFVKNGGTFVATYWSGIVNENDLCFLGGFPGPLRKVLGIWSEEIESLYDDESNNIIFSDNNKLGLKGEYETGDLIDLIHVEAAEVLATYKSDFFAGRPALTVNEYGSGNAYYIASRNKDDFNEKFYGDLITRLGIKPAVNAKLPRGVTAQLRTDGENDFIFLMNFNNCDEKIILEKDVYEDMLSGSKLEGEINLTPFGFNIMKRKSQI